jgi:hypothetical protein
MVKRRRQIVEGEEEEDQDEEQESPHPRADSTIKKWLTAKKSTETKKKPAAAKSKAEPVPADSIDLKIGKVKKARKAAQSPSSLLANMAPPTKAPPVMSGGSDPKKAPLPQKMGTKLPVNKQQNANARLTPPIQASSTARGHASAAPPRAPPQQQPPPQAAAAVAPGNSGKGISSLSIPNQEKILLRRLQGFCETLVKQETVVKVSGLGPIDVGGSCLPPTDALDFFDTNEQGEIVLPAQDIPIFPEDFPAGQREHPLSWWGIVDPEHGRGKYGPMS